MNSRMLPGFTLPPYWTRTAAPTSRRTRSASVCADHLDDLARVAGLGVPPGPDRPDRLVGDTAVAACSAVDAVEAPRRTCSATLSPSAGVALLQRLPHAHDRHHPVREDGLHLLVHDLVVLAEELPALGVPHDHVATLSAASMRGDDLARERALVLRVDVLRAEAVRELVGRRSASGPTAAR